MADPLPVSSWRDHLKDLARAMLYCAVVMLASAAAVVIALAAKGAA